MKRKIKLKDMTKEQWISWLNDNCLLTQKCVSSHDCNDCPFNHVNCYHPDNEDAWINNKDLYSRKFLNQKVEIEVPDI